MTLIDDTCDGCGSRFDPMGDPLLTKHPEIGPYAVFCARCEATNHRALLTPAPASETAREGPQPVRPYAPGTPLVIVSETEWDEAREAFSDVPELQDTVANANAYAERMPDRIADFLLSYSADGDTTQPWQDGHNYAMREAARMVRERWFNLGPVAGEPHWIPDGPNGETTMCECPKGIDHD